MQESLCNTFKLDCLTSAGACREATLVHGPNGTFVGEDELGNRYYENNNNQIGKCSRVNKMRQAHIYQCLP